MQIHLYVMIIKRLKEISKKASLSLTILIFILMEIKYMDMKLFIKIAKFHIIKMPLFRFPKINLSTILFQFMK